MSTTDSYIPTPAELVEVIDETPSIKTLVLAPAEPMSFRAGQFIQLTMPGVGEGPFTPSSSPSQPELIAITVLRTGTVTERLHECRSGQVLGLRGPFGKGYPIEKLAGGQVLVVGGGVGLAPLRALILALLDDLDPIKRMSIRYGARNMEELLFRREYDQWASHAKVDVHVTIDNPQPGWQGPTGVVTTLLKDLDMTLPECTAFVCGPGIMLKFSTQALEEEGLAAEQIYLSMNRRIICGMGLCGRCNIGKYYLCKDGPDMNYAMIKDAPNVF